MLSNELLQKAQWFAEVVKVARMPVSIPSDILHVMREDDVPDFYYELRRRGCTEVSGHWIRRNNRGKR